MWRVIVTSLVLATLLITDGTTVINLLDPKTGFCLANYAPVSAGFKGGGVWRDSSLAEGRRLADKKFGNINETFTLDLTHHSQDSFARSIQNLERLILKAADYWTEDAQNEPVWIEAQSACETNKRYALIHTGQLSELPDPYGQPVWGIEGQSSASSLILGIERSFWLENEPGTGTATSISGQQGFSTATTWSGSPAQSSDDGYVTVSTFNLTAINMVVGAFPATDIYGMFARFPNVTVPQGSTILNAYVQFRASATDGGNDCNVVIRGEATGNSATFSDRANYYARNRTNRSVFWTDIEDWTAGSDYTTPDLSAMIEEIVSRDDWASGNALSLFFEDNKSDDAAYRRPYSWDDPDDPAPILYITYRTTDETSFGRAATTTNEVYVANKQNRANFTHAYHYDASLTAWSGNLIGAATPFNLLPNPVQNNDILYLGIQTSVFDSGPFASAVFDIGTAATYVAAATGTWQYYNGAWGALSVRDNTDISGGSSLLPFSVAGVNSVHWQQQSDWIPVAINGITAYWVRVIFTIGGGDSVSVPTQQNRDIYSILWPRVDIASSQIGGDVDALARIKLYGQSNEDAFITDTGGDPTLWLNRILIGSRKYSRGADYTPYINLSNEQNPTGITVSTGPSTVSFATDTTAPSGVSILFNPVGVTALDPIAFVEIGTFGDSPLATQYYGTYRAFLRYYQSGGSAGDFTVQLQVASGSVSSPHTTEELLTEYTNQFNFFDFGKITIQPPGTPSPTDEADLVEITILASAASGTPNLYLYDLILLPSDEWLLDTEDVKQTVSSPAALTPGRYVDMDGIGQPKSDRSVLRDLNDYISSNWSLDVPVQLKNNEQLRLWFFCTRLASNAGEDRSDPEIANSVQVEHVQRYKFMRGDR